MKKITTILASAALAASLAACQPEPVPTPEPLPAPEQAGLVMNSEDVAEIMTEIGDSLAEADAAASTENIGARVVGPALTMRGYEYSLAAVTEGAVPVTPLSTTSQTDIIPATTEWPRVVNVITTIPDGANLAQLMTLTQEDARSPYALWAWVRLFPNATLPETDPAGVPVLAADDDSLLMSPQDTIAAYSDLLNNGDGSAHAASFAPDPFRTGWGETVTELQTAVEAAGTSSQTTAVNGSGVRAVGTADGGAIVTAALDQHLAVTRTVAGSTLSVGPTLAYGGDPNVVGGLLARYLTTVAFYVPPAGSEEPISVLGAEQVLRDVLRDDSMSPDAE